MRTRDSVTVASLRFRRDLDTRVIPTRRLWFDSSVLALDAPRWAELRTAYGAAGDIPEMLRDLESVPNSKDYRDEPWFSIWSALAHQGDVYSASFAAVPHVVRTRVGTGTRGAGLLPLSCVGRDLPLPNG